MASSPRPLAREALACRAAHEAGSQWPPHRAASSDPRFELRPGSGRRGPEEPCRRSDVAVSELNRSATGTDLMLQVADGYGELADVAGELASAVEGEDRASGLLPRARRSA